MKRTGGSALAAQFNPQTMVTPSPTKATDEEIESFLLLEFSGERVNRWRIWIEQLRDHTVGLWSTLGRRGRRMTADEYRHLVENDFQLVMDKLLLTGLLTIKYDAGGDRFRDVVDLLVAIFDRWRDARRLAPWPNQTNNYAPEVISEKVPMLEAYFAAYSLLGFSLRVSPDVSYASKLFPRIVEYAPSGETENNNVALLFWTYRDDDLDKNIDDLIAARMPRGGRIERLFEGEDGLREAIVQADCYVEWHSNLSQPRVLQAYPGYPITPFSNDATLEFYQTFFPNLNFIYRSICRIRSFRLVKPLLKKMHQSLLNDATRFGSFDFRLASILDAMTVETRELLLGRFLWYLEREQTAIASRRGSFPSSFGWPKPLDQLVERAKNESKFLQSLRNP